MNHFWDTVKQPRTIGFAGVMARGTPGVPIGEHLNFEIGYLFI